MEAAGFLFSRLWPIGVYIGVYYLLRDGSPADRWLHKHLDEYLDELGKVTGMNMLADGFCEMLDKLSETTRRKK